jgi:hypothetical protein
MNREWTKLQNPLDSDFNNLHHLPSFSECQIISVNRLKNSEFFCSPRKVTLTMLLLIALFSLSSSYFCKERLEIRQNVPESYEGPLGDGEVLCINSTVPYLTLVPQPTTLLKIRYFSRKLRSTQVVSSGHFFFPSEIVALGFGNSIGHIEIQALIPGAVSLSTFAFPPECRQHRYLTTMDVDSFSIAQRLGIGPYGEAVASSACIWSPHPLTSVHANSNVDTIRVCLPGQCQVALRGDSVPSFEFRSSQYVHIDANKPDFVKHFKLILSVRESADFLNAHGLLENDAEVGTIKLHPRDANEEHPKVGDEVPLLQPVSRQGRPRSRPIRSVIAVLQVFAIVGVIIGTIVYIFNYFLSATHRDSDDAESALLGAGDTKRPLTRFPQFLPRSPNYGAGSYQLPGGLGYVYPSQPFPGAVFPVAAPADGPPQQPQ